MIEVDPGHEYLLDSYDGGEPVRLVFMKREGDGYPFNIGHHPGTNCQEGFRALIRRVQYLQTQVYSRWNVLIVLCSRVSIWAFEQRAARRHGRRLPLILRRIETLPTCRGCGHIRCSMSHHI